MSKSLNPLFSAMTGAVAILVPLTPALSQVAQPHGTARVRAVVPSTLQLPRDLLPSEATAQDVFEPAAPTPTTTFNKVRRPVMKHVRLRTPTLAAKRMAPADKKMTDQRITLAAKKMARPAPVTAKVSPAKKPPLAVAALAPSVTATLLPKRAHHVVIQVSQNDPAVMNMVLNNAENLTKYYREKGEEIQVELVAYGPGLHMVRSDTSPVRARLKALAETTKQVTFSACENTKNAQAKQENIDIALVPEAHLVATGIGRITELQEQGWTYVRP